MFRGLGGIFGRKLKSFEEELASRIKIESALDQFISEHFEGLPDVRSQVSFTIQNGLVRIQTDNKLIAQEIAIRIRILDELARSKGARYNKMLI